MDGLGQHTLTVMTAATKTHRHSVAKILSEKQKIMQHPGLVQIAHLRYSHDTRDVVLAMLMQLLPRGIDEDALKESLSFYYGQELTSKVLNSIVWRLLGNIAELKAGRPVSPWTGQRVNEWVPVQFMGAHRWFTRRGEQAAIFDCLVLAGTPCGQRIEKTWTRKFCSVLARRLGFSAPFRDKPFKDCMEFVNLRCSALIDVTLSGSKPDFEQVSSNGTELTWNRHWLRLRSHAINPCPKGYEPDHPCYSCHVGMDQCDRAVHDCTYFPRHCTECDEVGWFDPAAKHQGMCVECYHAKLRSGG